LIFSAFPHPNKYVLAKVVVTAITAGKAIRERRFSSRVEICAWRYPGWRRCHHRELFLIP
jgi:hypothetical protein